MGKYWDAFETLACKKGMGMIGAFLGHKNKAVKLITNAETG
jgi:hypothetical protein